MSQTELIQSKQFTLTVCVSAFVFVTSTIDSTTELSRTFWKIVVRLVTIWVFVTAMELVAVIVSLKKAC